MHDHTVAVGDIRLQVRQYPGEGPAIVFLHFGGGNLMVWDGVVPFFTEPYRPVLLDLRGHGKSDRPTSGYHIDSLAGDVVAAMDVLSIERAHIVGSSMGAETAVALAANHPDRIISITCDGASASEYGPYSLWQGSEAGFRAHAAATIDKIATRSRPTFGTVDESLVHERQKYQNQGFWNPSFEAMVRYGIREVEPGRFCYGFAEYLLDYMRHYFGYRFEEYYRRIRCPVLFLPSAQESSDPAARAVLRGLAQLTGRASIVEVPGWIHPYGWLLDPQAASTAVLGFLAGLGSNKRSRLGSRPAVFPNP